MTACCCYRKPQAASCAASLCSPRDVWSGPPKESPISSMRLSPKPPSVIVRNGRWSIGSVALKETVWRDCWKGNDRDDPDAWGKNKGRQWIEFCATRRGRLV